MDNNVNFYLLTIVVSIGLLLGIIIALLDWQISILAPLGGFIILFELKKIRKRGTFDYLSYINIMYFIVFVLAPINLLINKQSVRHFLQTYDFSTVILSVVIIYFAYLLILIGYRIETKGKERKDVFSIDGFNQDAVNRVLKNLCVVFFVIGIGSFLLYAKIYGGIIELYEKSDFIRSGYVENNGFVFLKNFHPYVLLSSWILFSFLLLKKANKLILWILSILLLIIAMAILFSNAGRLELVYAVLPVFLSPYVIKKRLPPVSLSLVFIMLSIFWFVVGDMIFSLISYGVSIQPLEHKDISFYFYSFLSEFTHPYESLIIALSKVPIEMSMRFFGDFLYGLISLIPERLLGISVPDTIASYNTYFLEGKFESTVPPGLLALLFYSFMIPGIMIGSLLFGIFAGKTEKFLAKLEYIHPFFGFIKTAVGITFAFFIMSGEPRVYVQTWFWLFSGLLIIYLSIKVFCKSKYDRQIYSKSRDKIDFSSHN
jgi:oligosaccharide repeat unit polymerase